MAVFNIDPDMISEIIGNALDEVGSQASEEQFSKIVEAIEKSMPGVIKVLTYGMEENWKNMAKGSPTGWGQKYANSIKSEVEGNVGTVFVDESIMDKGSGKPNLMYVKMVEEGMRSFSIKDALLASDKAKIGPNGVKYITVPFPVATPRKASQGKQSSHFGGREMTNEMHRIVKSGGKIASAKLKSGQDVSGLTQYNTRQLHSQYGIFRRVSEKSKGWIHPGVMASPVYPKVMDEVNKRVGEIMSGFCKAIVKEFTT